MACNHVAIMLRQRRREYNSLTMHLLLRLELNIFSLDSATCYLRVMDSHIRETRTILLFDAEIYEASFLISHIGITRSGVI